MSARSVIEHALAEYGYSSPTAVIGNREAELLREAADRAESFQPSNADEARGIRRVVDLLRATADRIERDGAAEAEPGKTAPAAS